MTYQGRTRSGAWFLLPIALGLIGGIIAYFVLRNDDPDKAKNCLYLGIVLMFVGIVLNGFWLYALPEIGSGFDVKL